MDSKTSAPTPCRRCGSCCLKGGPALHADDLPLLREGVLAPAHLFTLRRGETVFDQPSAGLVQLEREVVKIRGTRGTAPCLFYDQENAGCAVYARRPLECRVLLCTDPAPLMRIYAKERLDRVGILGRNNPLARLAADHDQGCPVRDCLGLAKRFASGHKDALDGLAAMVRLDEATRRLCVERADVPPEELDFLLGRPLTALLEQEGVRADPSDPGRVRFSIIAPKAKT